MSSLPFATIVTSSRKSNIQSISVWLTVGSTMTLVLSFDGLITKWTLLATESISFVLFLLTTICDNRVVGAVNCWGSGLQGHLHMELSYSSRIGWILQNLQLFVSITFCTLFNLWQTVTWNTSRDNPILNESNLLSQSRSMLLIR